MPEWRDENTQKTGNNTLANIVAVICSATFYSFVLSLQLHRRQSSTSIKINATIDTKRMDEKRKAGKIPCLAEIEGEREKKKKKEKKGNVFAFVILNAHKLNC